MENALDSATIKDQLYAALKNVYDPELGVNIIDLGLVYAVDMREDGYVTLTMTLTTPGCPMHESIGDGVGVALSAITDGSAPRIIRRPPRTGMRGGGKDHPGGMHRIGE